MQSHGATLLAKMLSVLSYEMFTVLCNLGGYCTDHFQCPSLLSIEFCRLVFPVSIYQKTPKNPRKATDQTKPKKLKPFCMLTSDNTLFASRFSFPVLFLLLSVLLFWKLYFILFCLSSFTYSFSLVINICLAINATFK